MPVICEILPGRRVGRDGLLSSSWPALSSNRLRSRGRSRSLARFPTNGAPRFRKEPIERTSTSSIGERKGTVTNGNEF
jgi:hypothetical protein